MQTRREFLKFAAMMSGATGLSAFIPESIQRAYAIVPEPGSTYLDAEHIVILMQENRSFDHAFGALQGVRGFNDPRAIRLANGNSVFVQTDSAGNSYVPWRMGIHETRATWTGSLPHSRESQVDAWNEGLHDGWLDAKRSHQAEYSAMPLTMGCYTRNDLLFYYALADAFTICDQNYCSAMTSTLPNRSYLWTGTVRDKKRPDSNIYMRNEEYDVGGLNWKTYPERLQDAGISWRCYQNELTVAGGLTHEEQSWLSNFICNILENFSVYNVEAYSGCTLGLQERIAALELAVQKLEHKAATSPDPTLRYDLAHKLMLLKKLRASSEKSGTALYEELSRQQQLLHNAAFVTNTGDPRFRKLETLAFRDGDKQQKMQVPAGDIFYQFREDVNKDKLPTVSWLVAPAKFSDHPAVPWYGAWYVSEAINILASNPEIWKKTIFILTYDENDGYFDHAPVFGAADPKRPATGRASTGLDTGLEYTYAADDLRSGVDPALARSAPIGMGFRVPMIIASPWSRGGWVNSQLFDQTATLLFIEKFCQNKYGKDVKEENLSTWRRAIVGDLTSVFRPYVPDHPELSYINRDSFVVGIQEARYKREPSGYKALTEEEIGEVNRGNRYPLMPEQELGIRPACALPYELYADGSMDPERKLFKLRLRAGSNVHGEKSVGSPFNVYLGNLFPDNSPTGKRASVGTYTVGPGQTLEESFPLSLFSNSRYSIDVHGPNGFYRSFTGDVMSENVNARIEYEQQDDRITGNVLLLLANSGARSVGVSIIDNMHKSRTRNLALASGQETVVTLETGENHNWYDFAVRVSGHFGEARFAGHVDRGSSSFTDPVMGGVMQANPNTASIDLFDQDGVSVRNNSAFGISGEMDQNTYCAEDSRCGLDG